jgi:hypothetical protein
MRRSGALLGCLIAVACAGCPGTIEDPASFEELGQAAARQDAGEAGAEDAAQPADAGALDAAPEDPEEDANTPQEAGPAVEDASSMRDAALAPPSDASIAEAGDEAGSGCDFKALIMAKCGSSGCHGAPAVSNGLDLTSADLTLRLAGRRGSGSCSPYLLIDPATPSQSALYLKVTPDACGSRMPLGGTLTDGEQACILRWIESQN